MIRLRNEQKWDAIYAPWLQVGRRCSLVMVDTGPETTQYIQGRGEKTDKTNVNPVNNSWEVSTRGRNSCQFRTFLLIYDLFTASLVVYITITHCL